MATYYEKLKDPRWQKKRLEVMSRAKFSCQVCGDKTRTQNVHHGYYEKGLEPWEYPLDTLWCLCEPCHKEAQVELANAQRAMARLHPSVVEYLDSVIPGLQDQIFGPQSVFHEMLSNNAYGNHCNIVCPTCHFEYTHIVNTRTEDGTTILDFECESGHEFSMQFRFHKGVTLAEVKKSAVPDLQPVSE